MRTFVDHRYVLIFIPIVEFIAPLIWHGKSNAVFVDKLEQLAEVLGVFRAAALTGEFDRAILLLKSRSS